MPFCLLDDPEFEFDWYEAHQQRSKELDAWKEAAVSMDLDDYDAIKLIPHSLIPMMFLGDVKLDSEGKLVAFKWGDVALHRSPTYEGPF